MIRYEILSAKSRLTKGDVADFNHLLAQVSRTPRRVSIKEIRGVLKNGIIFVARDERHPRRAIVGMATLVTVFTLSRARGDVHDVVVDESYRGKGIGTKLMRELIVHARNIGLARIDLTSGPDREEANKLYKKLGFTIYKTNYYRLNLPKR